MLSVDYKKKVFEHYKNEWNANRLSHNLQHLTRANLRQECLNVLEKRYGKKDEKTLEAFFGYQKDLKGYRKAIDNFDLNNFRALEKFMKKDKVSGTNIKNVELLAWLTGFEPRPFELDYNGPLIEEVADDSGTSTEPGNIPPPQVLPEDEEENTNDTETQSPIRGEDNGPSGGSVSPPDGSRNKDRLKRGWENLKSRKGLGSMIALLLVGSSSYFSFGPLFEPQCMYWDKTQYKLVACDDKSKTTPVVKRNNERLSGFKLISDIESYRPNFLGRVWYAKIGGKYEYYTDSGMHPIDTARKLKPITVYHINKYLKAGSSSTENTVAAR